MTSPRPAAQVISALTGYPAWALIRRATRAGNKATIGAIGGTPWAADSLLDVPLESGPPQPGRTVDRLLAVPFRQIAERGFELGPAYDDDDTPLTVVDIEFEAELAVSDVVAALPEVPLEFTDRGGFTTSDDEYERVVRTVIDQEIGQGEGANLVIGRQFRAVVGNWSKDAALGVYRRLLAAETGAYWTFIFYTGERYLIGASPERHVSASGGALRMNPISGTFRLPREVGNDPEAVVAAVKPRLLDFLRDRKETFELFMVVDEELKMMCDLCAGGGQVVGPFLKPMSHLIHTEYLLAGATDRDPREILRDTLFAATVTGSPVENAVRLIGRYEEAPRGYYGAALAILGRDGEGGPVLDSPIVIRTADVTASGALTVTAGATLVRDSCPASEVAETAAKAAGILAAFGLVPAAPPASGAGVAELLQDDDVLTELSRRNALLAPFWLSDQAGHFRTDPRLAGKAAVVLDGGDDFAKMLRHQLTALGLNVTLIPQREYRRGCLRGYDLAVLGPGPGDPRDLSDPKMANLAEATADLLADPAARFLAVCLGHQGLCHALGLELAYKDIVFQGTQSPVELNYGLDWPLGDVEPVGFYNTFVAKAPACLEGRGFTVDAEPTTGDVHAIYGPNFAGIQFHAESILTTRGIEVTRKLLSRLLRQSIHEAGGG
ncbi:MAG: anthranilate synthase family protein [Promicromonosporaceae bacterium]|nr:anthranilate synthase family protein [Promicromonosporaceae bacterium]